jgi:small-conductance mechanosensitive channel
MLRPATDNAWGVYLTSIADTWLIVAAWFAVAHLIVRALDFLLWPLLARRPPRLLTDLAAAMIWVAAALLVIGRVLEVPLTGILTTSGVAVAVLGFALRDMLASLFAGIALNVEHPYRIGDWLEVAPGTVGRVVEVGWLTTRLVTLDDIGLVVSNAQLVTRGFSNFNQPRETWRDQVTFTLGYEVSPARAERILLAAAAEVVPVNTAGRRPDTKIVSCGESGAVWHLRYWLKDYAERMELRHQVHAAALRHLYKAGLAPAHQKLDLFHTPMPPRIDYRTQLDTLLQRSELFGHLSTEDLGALASAARRLRVPAGTSVVRQGEPGNSLFVVVEGVFDVDIRIRDGSHRRIRTVTPGEMFGEYSLLVGAPRTATIKARTDSLVFEITKDDLLPVIERCPELAEAMSHTLIIRQADLERSQAAPAEGPAIAAAPEHGFLQRIRAFLDLP